MQADSRGVTLGTGTVPLLRLEAAPDAAPLDRRRAGLFHTAFLLPSRADLGRWLGFVAETRVPLQGASDHIVSEAIYLADPDGNGIELYRDRPAEEWPRGADGSVAMGSERLDLEALLAEASPA